MVTVLFKYKISGIKFYFKLEYKRLVWFRILLKNFSLWDKWCLGLRCSLNLIVALNGSPSFCWVCLEPKSIFIIGICIVVTSNCLTTYSWSSLYPISCKKMFDLASRIMFNICFLHTPPNCSAMCKSAVMPEFWVQTYSITSPPKAHNTNLSIPPLYFETQRLCVRWDNYLVLPAAFLSLSNHRWQYLSAHWFNNPDYKLFSDGLVCRCSQLFSEEIPCN